MGLVRKALLVHKVRKVQRDRKAPLGRRAYRVLLVRKVFRATKDQ